MELTAIAVALLIAGLWGLSPILHKVALHDISPETIMVVSCFFYTVCAAVLAFVYRRRVLEEVRTRMTPKILVYIAVGAIVCGFLTNVIYFRILKHHDSYIISALIYSSPVFTLLLAFLLLREHIHFLGFMGVVLITAGVVCIAFNPGG